MYFKPKEGDLFTAMQLCQEVVSHIQTIESAWNTRNEEVLAKLYADEAALMWGESVLKGRSAIQRQVRFFFLNERYAGTIRLLVVGVHSAVCCPDGTLKINCSATFAHQFSDRKNPLLLEMCYFLHRRKNELVILSEWMKGDVQIPGKEIVMH